MTHAQPRQRPIAWRTLGSVRGTAGRVLGAAAGTAVVLVMVAQAAGRLR